MWEICALYNNSVTLDIVAIKAIMIGQLLLSLGVNGLHSLCVSLLAVPRSLSLKDSWVRTRTELI